MTFSRFPLAVLPTPLTRAPRLERALDAPPIWIKRDDLTGFATAGTKARALEFLIADARISGADRIVATGSPSSNFCAVAALAARAAGLGCDVLYSGAPTAPRPLTVQLATAAGARVCFDPSLAREELDAAAIAHADELTSSGTRAYPVPRGGATAVGALGCAYAARELAAQCAQQHLHPAAVVVATGSGGSQAGLVAGQVAFGLPIRVIGASVSRPVEHARPRLRRCLGRRLAKRRTSPEPRGAVARRHLHREGDDAAAPAGACRHRRPDRLLEYRRAGGGPGRAAP